jgi:hypothetical protein
MEAKKMIQRIKELVLWKDIKDWQTLSWKAKKKVKTQIKIIRGKKGKRRGITTNSEGH